MLRNYLTAAVRNLARNWLYAGITILGLAAGFAAAILIGLYVRDEYSFEHFISGYEQIYRLETDVIAPGQEPVRGDTVAKRKGPGGASAHQGEFWIGGYEMGGDAAGDQPRQAPAQIGGTQGRGREPWLY